MKMLGTVCENRNLRSGIHWSAFITTLLWIATVGPSIWAQGPGQAGILDGNAGRNGGTVKIAIKLRNGTRQSFEVKVAPGEKSSDVMKALANKIDQSTSFSAGSTSFTIGDGSEKKTVDSVNIISLDGPIDSIRINPDDSGFKQFGSSPDANLSNDQSLLLFPHGSPLPGQVEFSAVLGDPTSILADASVLVPNGTSVSTILDSLSSQLVADGVNSRVIGDVLTVDVGAGETLLMGGSPFSRGLTNIAYGQVVYGSGSPTPEPSSLLLLGSGVLGLGGFLRKRFLKPS